MLLITIFGAGVAAMNPVRPPHMFVNRLPPLFLIQWGGPFDDKNPYHPDRSLLLEPSDGAHRRLTEFGNRQPHEIRHIAVSHAHPDHCSLLPYLQSLFCGGLWHHPPIESVKVYGPHNIPAAFPLQVKAQIPELTTPWYDHPRIDFVTPADRAAVIGDATLRAWHVYHGFGRCPALAFRLETPDGIVAYSGDSGLCPGLQSAFTAADVIICEASLCSTEGAGWMEGYGHLTAYQAGRLAFKAGAATLILVHYTGLESDGQITAEVARSRFSGRLILGKDFTRYAF